MPVLAHPPERQRAKHCQRRIGGRGGAIRRQHIGPDDRVTVQKGGPVGQALVHIRLGLGAEGGQTRFPGAVHVISREPAIERGFVDQPPQRPQILQGRVAGLGLARSQRQAAVVVVGCLDDALDGFVIGGAIGQETPRVLRPGKLHRPVAGQEPFPDLGVKLGYPDGRGRPATR